MLRPLTSLKDERRWFPALAMDVTVIICAHNPRPEILARALGGLAGQTLDGGRWELVLVDNRSTPPLDGRVAFDRIANARIVREEVLGLTPARLAGCAAATAPLLVFVDDDNVLHEGYLERAVEAFAADADLGIAGGRNHPEYEVDPPEWFGARGAALACRDLGDKPIYTDWRPVPRDKRQYEVHNPVGAGMVIRREAIEPYAAAIMHDPRRRALDRTGNSLVSGGDNDIVMTALEQGWKAAYLPQLQLVHIIPRGRLELAYHVRLSREANRSWVLVLDLHGIRPWKRIPPAAVWPLKCRHYLRTKPWRGPHERIAYAGICGRIEGRSLLK